MKEIDRRIKQFHMSFVAVLFNNLFIIYILFIYLQIYLLFAYYSCIINL
jgi:hypothetical protein